METAGTSWMLHCMLEHELDLSDNSKIMSCTVLSSKIQTLFTAITIRITIHDIVQFLFNLNSDFTNLFIFNSIQIAPRVNLATYWTFVRMFKYSICLNYTWRFQYFKHSAERLPHKCQESLYFLGALSKAISLSNFCVQHVRSFHGLQNLYATVSSEGLAL